MSRKITDKILVILLMFFILVNLIGNNVSFALDPFAADFNDRNSNQDAGFQSFEDTVSNDSNADIDLSQYGISGNDDISAYNNAKSNGYTGTQEEYTEYYYAVKNGDFEGSIQDWQNDQGMTSQEPENEPEQEEDEEDLSKGEQIVKIIRDSVAKWYYVMRLIVIAFMLILLIFIGIKMAISTIASEKAIYKQMLVDWVAGMIIVFCIHYIMIFILNINESIINSLKPLAKEKSTIQEEYQYGDEAKKKTADEIEITLYESARTRAYSMKLTDGFTGMCIYGALVYYAWRFAFMYFKRMINIVMLTLMAPPVSASYAFNKVLTGKSKIFSTWLSEYIMNVIIQVVHVVIYVSFVSVALQLSLVSLPGTILAFVFLSFMLKADKILRQIFKIAGGKGSLAGDMAGSTLKELKDDMKSLQTAMVGGKYTQMAAKATYRVATKPIRKAGEVAFGSIMAARANDAKREAKEKEAQEKKEEEYIKGYEEYKKGNINDVGHLATVNKLNDEREALLQQQAELEDKIKTTKKLQEKYDLVENDALQKDKAELAKIQEQIEQNEDDMQEAYLKYYMSSGTLGGTVKDGIKSLFSPNNYVESRRMSIFGKEFGEKKYRRKKTRREGGVNGAFWRKKRDGVGMRFMEKAKWDKMLGISADEKKVLQEEAKFLKSSILGVMTSIVGFPALAVSPGLGMGLLAQAGLSRMEIATRRRRLKNRPAYKNSKYYKFEGFGAGAHDTMNNEAMAQIKRAESEITKRNMKKHKKLAKMLIDDVAFVTKPIRIAGVTVSGMCLGMPVGGGIHGEIARKMGSTKFTGKVFDITTFEEDKLDGLYQKKLRDGFKEAKKQFVYAETKKLREDYNQELNTYEDEIEKQNVKKSTKELMMQNMLAGDNTIGIGNNIVEVETEDEISNLVESANKIDLKDGISRSQKIAQIKEEISKRETKLIESSITKLCSDKGIQDIKKLKLNGADNIEIKKNIIGALEEKGIIKKGEIKLGDDLVSNEKIETVFDSLSQNSEEANENIEKKIVQDAYLEYMAKENITDVKNLKKDEAKQGIYDIIIEKLMSAASKSSARVISQLTGKDKMKEEFELSDSIKQNVEKTSKKVKVINKADFEEDEIDKKKLIHRETNRLVNQTKDKLEQAIYTGDDENLDDERELKMLFYLSEIGRQNEKAQKAGEKKSEIRKEKTIDELKYYQRKDGSKRYDQSNDGNKDLSEKLKNLETRVHGPSADVIDLINRVGYKKKTQK